MLHLKTVIAATLGAAILMPPAARAQQAAAQAGKPNMELTALDYFQIQQLVSRYAQAIDTCSNGVDTTAPRVGILRARTIRARAVLTLAVLDHVGGVIGDDVEVHLHAARVRGIESGRAGATGKLH
jgi:hypothetical protein